MSREYLIFVLRWVTLALLTWSERLLSSGSSFFAVVEILGNVKIPRGWLCRVSDAKRFFNELDSIFAVTLLCILNGSFVNPVNRLIDVLNDTLYKCKETPGSTPMMSKPIDRKVSSLECSIEHLIQNLGNSPACYQTNYTAWTNSTRTLTHLYKAQITLIDTPTA